MVYGEKIEVWQHDEIIESAENKDPLGFVERFKDRYRVPLLPELPRFSGGLVGYFGYDTVRYSERRLEHSAPPDHLETPDVLLMVSNDVIVFTPEGAHDAYQPRERGGKLEATRARLRALAAKLSDPLPAEATAPPAGGTAPDESDFTSSFGQEAFKAAVEKIKGYTAAGDVMQVVLAQRMSVPFEAPPINLYRALRSLNPSPYMVFMDLGDFQLVSSSPEILARVEDRVITNRPLAGTRPRGATAEQDEALERELLADPKEIAEHLMLIDLGRNDVGRVAEIGSVTLTEQMVVERYSHVMHISSNVQGRLRAEFSALDVLRATLPVGTLSGAPKIRAMEIIDELEPTRRGVYGGALGYIAWNGNMIRPSPFAPPCSRTTPFSSRPAGASLPIPYRKTNGRKASIRAGRGPSRGPGRQGLPGDGEASADSAHR